MKVGKLNKRVQPVELTDAQLATLVAAMGGGGGTRRTLAVTDKVAPADNTAAVLLYTGIAAVAHVIGQITWGYDGDPTGGLLKIENSSGIVFSVPVTKSGPGQLNFAQPVTTGIAQDFKITLSAGGGTVQGYVSVTHWLEA